MYAARAPAVERGPRALPAHYEINGRDLKSGKLDAALAAEGGGGSGADQSGRSARALAGGAGGVPGAGGAPAAPSDIIFL